MLNLTQMNCLRALSRIAPQPFGLRWGGRSLTLRHCSTTSISTDPPSQTERVRPNIADNEFQALGLSTDILEALSAQGIKKPTPVQKSVIPRLLANENIVMAASTGSGKTLAYLLPAIEAMHNDELLGYQRQMKRPRCLILVPTRDLARQVLQATKSVGHYAKVSSAAVLGGEQYALQKKALDRVVDLVVASPGRLMQHKEQGNVFLSHVHTVIIDEVDTMLTQGFGSDLRAILRSVLARKEGPEGLRPSFQLIMATATLTKSVKALLQEVQSENGGAFDINYTDPSNPTPRKASPNKTTTAVEMKIVEVDGVHRSLPNVRHRFELTRGKDKLSLLKEILHASTGKNKNERILVFCNTVQSSRAVEYAINEDPAFHAVSYHGELNSREREKNLDDFRSGDEKLLVCTDLAARGLDIPDINHVVLFDFPLNPVDYLHRAGRCGRAGRAGKVTSLVSKRDEVLARAIELAIQRKEPIDALSSSKSSYAVTPTKTRKSFLDGVPRPRPKKTIIGSRGAPAGGRGGARGGKVATGGAKAGLRTERGKGGAKYSSSQAGGPPKRSDDVSSPRAKRGDDSFSPRASGSRRSDDSFSPRASGSRRSDDSFSPRASGSRRSDDSFSPRASGSRRSDDSFSPRASGSRRSDSGSFSPRASGSRRSDSGSFSPRASGSRRSDSDSFSPRGSGSRRSDDSSSRPSRPKRDDDDASSRAGGARSGGKFSSKGGAVSRNGGGRGGEERRGGRSVFSKQGNSSRSSSNRSSRK